MGMLDDLITWLPDPEVLSGAMGMLGGLLDADGDGNPMDDIFQMVMNRQ